MVAASGSWICDAGGKAEMWGRLGGRGSVETHVILRSDQHLSGRLQPRSATTFMSARMR